MKNSFSKRDAIKNYFPIPNEVYLLGLNPTELSIYAYLLRIENRTSFECYASYKTIAKAVGICPNTVRKYVSKLEERGLISTEHTSVITKDGIKRNGTLKYHINPIRFALDIFNEKQRAKVDAAAEKKRIAALLGDKASVAALEEI